jgi:ADP-ribose pyrophosphatase YjhB (NUDIX family)
VATAHKSKITPALLGLGGEIASRARPRNPTFPFGVRPRAERLGGTNISEVAMGDLHFAVKAIVVQDHKFLALKRSDENGDYWEIPGGRVEFGEKLKDTLHREVKEETGLEIISEGIFNSWDLIEESRQISGVIYLCRIKSGTVTLSDEHSEYDWFTTDDLSQLYPEFANSLTSLELV